MEFNGPGEITDSRITGNAVTVTTGSDPDALALATSGLAVSPQGQALTTCASIFNNSPLSLHSVVVRGNLASAKAPHAEAQGAGIWNGPFLSGPPVTLDLHDTTVTANRLTVSAGGTRQGAGLFTTVPVTFDHSAVLGNARDQCFGC